MLYPGQSPLSQMLMQGGASGLYGGADGFSPFLQQLLNLGQNQKPDASQSGGNPFAGAGNPGATDGILGQLIAALHASVTGGQQQSNASMGGGTPISAFGSGSKPDLSGGGQMFGGGKLGIATGAPDVPSGGGAGVPVRPGGIGDLSGAVMLPHGGPSASF